MLPALYKGAIDKNHIIEPTFLKNLKIRRMTSAREVENFFFLLEVAIRNRFLNYGKHLRKRSDAFSNERLFQ
jgi:hypothetical protein